MQQLSEKSKGAEDLNKMIQNPDELERLLNELVDYFHQLHFLAVIVNLFNVINASTGFAVNIKKNSSGTTSLELQRTQNDLNEGVTPSTLPASTRKMFGKGLDPKAELLACTEEHKQLRTDHDQLKQRVERSNVEIDAHHDERNQLIASIQSALQKLDGEESEDEESVKGVSDTDVSDRGVSSTRRTEDGEPVNQADLRTIQAAGDEALRKLSENISIMEEKHTILVGKQNALAESLKRNRRSTLLHVQKPVTGDWHHP
jgi:hypothetical protein